MENEVDDREDRDNVGMTKEVRNDNKEENKPWEGYNYGEEDN